MFSSRFFSSKYFGDRYFAPAGAPQISAIIQTISVTAYVQQRFAVDAYRSLIHKITAYLQ
jgi:hypothetical protein